MVVSNLEVGARMDLGRTAVGRAYLASIHQADRDGLLESLRIATGNDWPSVISGLKTGLEDAIRQGFALSTGEWHRGVNAVAAGFVGPSGHQFAVNCGGAEYQAPRAALLEIVAPALLECIAGITKEVGGVSTAMLI